MDHLKSLYTEFVTILFLFYVLVFWLQGMWDLSSLTRDWTHIPCIRWWSPNHWPAREVPSHFGFNFAFPKWRLGPFHMPVAWLDTSFWGGAVKQKRIALLFCQAKGDRTGFCLEKLCVSTPENLMRVFIRAQRWYRTRLGCEQSLHFCNLNNPAMQETWVWFLGREDLLEKG